MVLAALWLGVDGVQAAGGKDRKSRISFHLEGDPSDGQKRVLQVGNRCYQRVPILTIDDFSAFRAFPAKDGKGFGVVLTMLPHAANRARAAMGQAEGKSVLPIVNGKATQTLRAGHLKDDKMVVWSGVSEEELKQLEEDGLQRQK